MEPSLVLFDVDGTLVDTAGAGRRALEAAFGNVLGLRDIALPSSRVRFEGKTDPTIIAEIAAEAGVPPGEIERQAARIRLAYLDALRGELARPDSRRRILPGVLPLLEDLASRPEVTLGLLTGNIEEGARTKLEAFGLNRFFQDGGYSSDDPDRVRIARIAMEKLSRRSGRRFPAERVTVVGDTELDVACARANGFRAVVVVSGWVARERLTASAPDALFEDLTDLPAVLRALFPDGGVASDRSGAV